MDNFRWQFAVLDDDESKAALHVRDLEALGLRGHAFSAANDFYDQVGLLSECHASLVDMKWENFGSHNNTLATFLPEGRVKEPRAFAKQWIDALHRWSIPENTPEQNSGRWPQNWIEPAKLGLWLAALISHINPDSEIVFFSTRPQRTVPELAAFSVFRNPNFKVFSSAGTGGLAKEAVWSVLERVQVRHLERDHTLRKWFIGSVLLRLIMGVDPLVGEIIAADRNGVPRRRTLECSVLFPQVSTVSDRVQKARMLRKLFLPSRYLTPRQRAVLEAVLHEFGNRKLEVMASRVSAGELTRKDLKDTVSELASRCLRGGEAGLSLYRGLVASLDDKLEIGQVFEILRDVWRNGFSQLYTAKYALQELSNQYSPIGEDREVVWPDKADDEMRADPQFRADRTDLANAIHHLKDNAVNHEGEGTWRLEVSESQHATILSWTDRSRGFTDIDAFRSKVTESCERSGSTRGLPLILTVALSLGVSEISLLVGSTSGGAWHRLFAAGEPEPLSSRDTVEPKFGLRFEFPKTSRKGV